VGWGVGLFGGDGIGAVDVKAGVDIGGYVGIGEDAGV
jgi:hypothetical protein